MNIYQFINEVVDRGIEAVRKDYSQPRQRDKLEGSIAGFEACRGKTIDDLRILFSASALARRNAQECDDPRFWWYVCYHAEVEWVCNCVSAVLQNEHKPMIITPTARGVAQAARILNGMS